MLRPGSGSDSAGLAKGIAFRLPMHHEFYLFVHKGDITQIKPWRSATRSIAKRFRFTNRDDWLRDWMQTFCLWRGNPLEDIDATLSIRGVGREGRPCSAQVTEL